MLLPGCFRSCSWWRWGELNRIPLCRRKKGMRLGMGAARIGDLLVRGGEPIPKDHWSFKKWSEQSGEQILVYFCCCSSSAAVCLSVGTRERQRVLLFYRDSQSDRPIPTTLCATCAGVGQNSRTAQSSQPAPPLYPPRAGEFRHCLTSFITSKGIINLEVSNKNYL